MSAVRDVLSAALLLSGTALALAAAVGLLRLPDLFSRMHAATKPATLGLLLVTVGAAVRVPDGGDASMLLLVAALQLLTAPVAAHMVGRAAYRARTPPARGLVVDDLRDTEP